MFLICKITTTPPEPSRTDHSASQCCSRFVCHCSSSRNSHLSFVLSQTLLVHDLLLLNLLLHLVLLKLFSDFMPTRLYRAMQIKQVSKNSVLLRNSATLMATILVGLSYLVA